MFSIPISLILDLQNVQITLRILHRPEPSKLPNIYLNIGRDYAERVLPSITNEVLKAVVVSNSIFRTFNSIFVYSVCDSSKKN